MSHGNRGRSPKHRRDEATRMRLITLAQSTYAGENYQHQRGLLKEREGIVVSRASVRCIVQPRLAAWSLDRKRLQPQHRQPRKCYAQEGTLTQIDGSAHDWLEERWLL